MSESGEGDDRGVSLCESERERGVSLCESERERGMRVERR